MPSYGKVAVAAVVGNEDGAHHVAAEVCQALAEVGFTIPSGGVTYWVGEVMGSTNYLELKSTPEAVAQLTPVFASNAAHLVSSLERLAIPAARRPSSNENPSRRGYAPQLASVETGASFNADHAGILFHSS